MSGTAVHCSTRGAAGSRLAPRIALVLFIKIVLLTVLWLLFVRDQRVAVDARSAAAAFGLLDSQPDSKVKSEGNVHGQ